jgi:hypothetical protein
MITKRILSDIKNDIPYNFKHELSGYIEKDVIHYAKGTKINCRTFPDKKVVFHTHVDVSPTRRVVTLPDLPSPVDILVFLVIDNDKMYIKTSRMLLTFEKTKKTKRVSDKVLRCIMENETHWKKMVRDEEHDRMFYFIVRFLRNNIDKKNRTWNLSWKRIIEQIFKIKVNIQPSSVKDHL